MRTYQELILSLFDEPIPRARQSVALRTRRLGSCLVRIRQEMRHQTPMPDIWHLSANSPLHGLVSFLTGSPRPSALRPESRGPLHGVVPPDSRAPPFAWARSPEKRNCLTTEARRHGEEPGKIISARSARNKALVGSSVPPCLRGGYPLVVGCPFHGVVSPACGARERSSGKPPLLPLCMGSFPEKRSRPKCRAQI